jgi:hypothetical protein
VFDEPHNLCRGRRINDVLGDNARVTCTEDQNIGTRRHSPLVVREDVFYKEAVVEEEEKRRQERNENDRIWNQVVLDVVVVDKVHRGDENQIENYYIEDSHTILNARVPDDTPVTVRDHDRKKATAKLNAQCCCEIVVKYVFDNKVESQKIAYGC